ncbi:hypothetical protein EDB83DRAFT_2519901 [Lactarius deliciosus]|nr:hypothetical protein EDB83DRAFT_2519901 [Lactarius deliciosus]
MNEDDTMSSSCIFLKIMMQEVTDSMGLPTLKERFADPEIKTVAHHRHLAPGGMSIEGTTRVVVMDGTVANRLRGIVGAVFRIQGRPLVGATSARVNVRRRCGRVGETMIETGITTAEEMTLRTDTGIAGAEAMTRGLSTCFAQPMSYCSICVCVRPQKKSCSSFECIL